MSYRSKVVWSEGLFLRPQHLQQNDRYLEKVVDLRTTALRSHGWGFSELRLDGDLLKLGKLAIAFAKGVFPDGTPFNMPEDDALPPPLDIEENARDAIVYLCLPVQRSGAQEVDLTGSDDVLARYDCRELEVRDVTNNSGDSALMQVGGVKARLMLDSNEQSEYARIPLAQVVEIRVDKQVVLQDAFIPTVCNVRTAAVLHGFTKELLGLLQQRGEALGGRVAATGRGGAAEIADFLLLQVVNRLQPLALHLANEGYVHPENFYRVCIMAAGELATFTHPSKRAPTLPPYMHHDLRASFEPVIGAIRESMGTVILSKAEPIPLKAIGYGYGEAVVGDKSLLKTANFVLAVTADMPAESIRSQFPSSLKIAPAEKIQHLVVNGLSGVPIVTLPVAPRQIPYNAGSVYFQMDRSNELWGQIAVSGGIAIHVNDSFPGLQMELWAIRE